MDALFSAAHANVMSSTMSISLSGMQAASAMLNVTANNIANLNTPGFNPSRADLVELSGGGVGVTGTSFENNPQTASSTQTSNVDLPTEMVNLKLSQTLYDANAMVLKTADQMTGTLLNVLDTDHDHDNDHS